MMSDINQHNIVQMSESNHLSRNYYKTQMGKNYSLSTFDAFGESIYSDTSAWGSLLKFMFTALFDPITWGGGNLCG
jgi:hypothetical protein